MTGPSSSSTRTVLSRADYLWRLRTESRRFRNVLTDLHPGTSVPACPGWTAADLLWHLTEVHWFWAGMVRDRPQPPAEDRGYPDRPAERDAVLELFDEFSADLHDELTRADPAEPAWSWVADQTVGFTLRRQTHEALVHRVDAEQAAGASSAVDAELAADGVSECLDVLYNRVPTWGSLDLGPHHVRVDCTDTGDHLWVRLGRVSGVDPADNRHRDFAIVQPADTPPAPAALTVAGTAADLDLWLWHRGGARALTVRGDPDVRTDFLAAISRTL